VCVVPTCVADYSLSFARLAKEGGAKHMVLMSSQGANKGSWFLYPQTKVQPCARRRMLIDSADVHRASARLASANWALRATASSALRCW
jgi:hypothetical protein